MPKPELSPEVANRIPAILEGFMEGKTLRKIAEEQGWTENQVYWVMRNEHAAELLYAKLREVDSRYMDKLDEMLESDNKTDQRTAVTELGKVTKQIRDKVYPSLVHSRTESLTANVDDLDRKRWEYVLQNLTPDVRGIVVDKYKEAVEMFPSPA